MTNPVWQTPDDTRRRARALLAQEAAERAAEQSPYNEVRLNLSYRLPPVYPLCDRDERRASHADLENMTPDELTTEAWRLRFVLAFGDWTGIASYGKPWAEERLVRIRALLKGGGA